MLLPDLKIDKLREKRPGQLQAHKDSLAHCEAVEGHYREVVSDFGHEKEEVEAKIQEARKSPQKLKMLQDIYLAHDDAESKARDLETTECMLNAYQDERKNKLKEQTQLNEQVNKRISMCRPAT